jgi:hypothetical protein
MATEAEIARMALDLSQQLADGEDAMARLAEIEEIVGDVIAQIPTTNPSVPWDALLAIRKALR